MISQDLFQKKTEFKYVKDFLPPPGLTGDLQFTQNLDVFTEFDELQMVVIGNIDHTSHSYYPTIEYLQDFPQDIDILPEIVVNAASQHQDDIAAQLKKRGIKVLRTGYVDHSKQFVYNGMKSKGYNNFNPRDLVFAFDDTLYEFPTHAVSRQEQKKNFQWIEQKLHRNGTTIMNTPGISFKQRLFEKEQNKDIHKTDIVFADAANLLKLGTDILFLISRSGSQGCYRRFRAQMEAKYNKRLRVHPMRNIYQGCHVDSSITPIGWNQKAQKYLVVVNGWNLNPKNMPPIFRGKNWGVIEINELEEQQQTEYDNYIVSSKMLAINMLALSQKTILMTDRQPRIHQILEFYGIDVLKMPHHYGRQVGGGFHCMSNDLKRKDSHGFREILTGKDVSKEKLAGFFDLELLQFLQQKGDLDNWVDICNENKIYPNYLTEHMTPEEKAIASKKHQQYI